MNHSAAILGNRRISAWISLLAALLIYAPVGSATLLAVAGGCCGGDQCPIHGNHHPAKEIPAQSNGDSPIDCDRHGRAADKTRACSMSCCHTVEQSARHALTFLLAPVSPESSFVQVSSAALAPTALEISPAFVPLAPPPRSFAT